MKRKSFLPFSLVSGGVSVELHTPPMMIGKLMLPPRNITATTSSGSGSVNAPNSAPAMGVASCAHADSSWPLPESQGSLTLTRPIFCSSSLFWVTTAKYTPLRPISPVEDPGLPARLMATGLPRRGRSGSW